MYCEKEESELFPTMNYQKIMSHHRFDKALLHLFIYLFIDTLFQLASNYVYNIRLAIKAKESSIYRNIKLSPTN